MRTRVLLLLFLAITVTTSACALPGRAKYVAYGLDAATMAWGTAILVDTASEDCSEDYTGLCRGLKGGVMLVGTSILLAGTTGLLANILLNRDWPKSKRTETAPAPTPSEPARPEPVATSSALDFSEFTSVHP